jgi:hypothetical protein
MTPSNLAEELYIESFSAHGAILPAFPRHSITGRCPGQAGSGHVPARRAEDETARRVQEVSTPEVDDVVRVEDDTRRGDGRIESEHGA